MKKSELRTGMITEHRVGDECVVMLNMVDNSSRLLLLKEDKFHYLDDFKEDLTGFSYREFDIVKVSKTPIYNFDLSDRSIIWERKEEVKEHTIEELIEKVGYEFKIKK